MKKENLFNHRGLLPIFLETKGSSNINEPSINWTVHLLFISVNL